MVIACNLLIEEESSPTNQAIKSGLSPELKLFLEDEVGNTAEEKIRLKTHTIVGLGTIKAQAAKEKSQDENPDKTQCNTDTGTQELDQGSSSPLVLVEERQGGSESSGCVAG